MDQEDIKLLKLKYRAQDKLLRPAVARIKLLAGFDSRFVPHHRRQPKD